MTFGGLQQVPTLYREACAKRGKKPARLMCSYFIHFADTPDGGRRRSARTPDPLLQGMRDPGACRAIRKTAPPSYRYFIDMVERLHKVEPEDLTENSVLLGSPPQIIDTLKKVEAAGFDEVILYFNVGLKPHQQ